MVTNLATLTLLRRIPVPNGDVFHALKASERSFAGFGEAYFTTVDERAVKGWKRHNQLTMNLVVPCGAIRIGVHNEATGATDYFSLGTDATLATYGRLTVPSGLWVAFGGLSAGVNLMLNVASMEHDPTEADQCSLGTFSWVWDGA